jgi:hypothetical protein
MEVYAVLWIIAAVLMFVSAFFEPPRVVLYKLAWGFFILGMIDAVGPSPFN